MTETMIQKGFRPCRTHSALKSAQAMMKSISPISVLFERMASRRPHQASFLRLVLTAIAVSCCIHAADLHGVILDDQGTAVNGAIVTIHRSPSGGPLGLTESYETTAQKDGTFVFQDLGAGAFVVCAAASGQLLDPCQWNDVLPTVEIPSNTGVMNYTLTLARGGTLNIMLADPAAALTAALAGKTQGIVTIGVRTAKGHLNYAAPVSVSAVGTHLYQIALPSSANLELDIQSRNLSITDGSGVSVVGKQGFTVSVGLGQTQQVSFTVAAAVQ